MEYSVPAFSFPMKQLKSSYIGWNWRMKQLAIGFFMGLWLQLPALKCDFDYKEPYPSSETYLTGKFPSRRGPQPYVFTGQFLTLVRAPPATNTTLSPVKPTPASGSCMSSTRRTNLGCYCYAIGQKCLAPFSICSADENGDGYCSCVPRYVRYQYQCLTQLEFDNITRTNVTGNLRISGPDLVASCFLPINSSIGHVSNRKASGTVTYSLMLIRSTPFGDSNRYIEVDPAAGTLIYRRIPPASLVSQVYRSVIKDANGASANRSFTVGFNCTAPKCAFDFGNSLIVDCLRFTIGDAVNRLQATESAGMPVYMMSLISSSSRTGNNFFRISTKTGQVILQKTPHGGIFVETYSVTAMNIAELSCPPLVLTLTTTETCV